jgi:hypothetical protein
MARRDYTDILGGALLVAFGLGVGFYAQRYNIGTLTRMGPGFFPAALGFLLALLGLAILLPGLRRAGAAPAPHWRALVTILVAISAFAFTVRDFGMVPATFLLVGIAALAQNDVRLKRTVVLAAALSALGVIIFARGLGVLLPAFAWPF